MSNPYYDSPIAHIETRDLRYGYFFTKKQVSDFQEQQEIIDAGEKARKALDNRLRSYLLLPSIKLEER